MNHINDAIVTPERIAKAKRIGRPGSVERLAAFVCVNSTDPWRVFEGCQQQRLGAIMLQREESGETTPNDRLAVLGYVRLR